MCSRISVPSDTRSCTHRLFDSRETGASQAAPCDCASCAAGTNCGGPLEATIAERSAGWTITFRSGSRNSCRNILQGEAVYIAFVGDEVEVGADACLGRVHKAKIPDYIDNPEILVAGGCFHDFLGRWQLDQCRVFDLGADGNNVLRVVLNGAGRFLGGDTGDKRTRASSGGGY